MAKVVFWLDMFFGGSRIRCLRSLQLHGSPGSSWDPLGARRSPGNDQLLHFEAHLWEDQLEIFALVVRAKKMPCQPILLKSPPRKQNFTAPGEANQAKLVPMQVQIVWLFLFAFHSKSLKKSPQTQSNPLLQC